jgi:hypothetical protein
MKPILSMFFVLIVTFLFAAGSSWGQDGSKVNIEILAEKVKADKKLVVAMNLDLSAKEAKGFWPVYDSYQGDLEHVNQRLGQLLSDYADAYNTGSVSNATAEKLIKEWIHAEAEEMKLRVEMVNKLAKVVPATKAARYLQIENKIRAVVRFALADNVPLVY